MDLLNSQSFSLDAERLSRIRQGTLVVPDSPAVFELTGPGALQCLQGLLTNDVVKSGDHSLVFGALLTPKGMIVVDYWVIRRADTLLLLAPSAAREMSAGLFSRQLPPRLARAVDRSESTRALWLLGDSALGLLRFAGLGPVPEVAGHVTEGAVGEEPLLIGRPAVTAPFAAMLVGTPAGVSAAEAALLRGGGLQGEESDLRAARILRGWPTLGTEIDEKTLPQEARFDEIDGVSYTKGCYVGQETVARLHFRGHANRLLRGLLWRDGGPPDGLAILTKDGKEVGSVRSTLQLPDRRLALGLVRRQVEPGTEVIAAGRSAQVITLPFGEAEIAG